MAVKLREEERIDVVEVDDLIEFDWIWCVLPAFAVAVALNAEFR